MPRPAIDRNSIESILLSRVREYEDHWLYYPRYTNGYGYIWFEGKRWRVHRLAAVLWKGLDPNSDLQINHIRECHYKNCIKPDHLYIGDQVENLDDIIKSGRNHNLSRTHCPQGHEYNEENTNTWGGGRHCKICMRERARAYYWRNKTQ